MTMSATGMDFDVDVSGEDIFSPDFTICIADRESKIRGFRFSSELISTLNSRFSAGEYRYEKSKKGRSQLKVRVYCIMIYFLFRSMKPSTPLNLTLCRDFYGKEEDIRNNLKFFLVERLYLGIERIDFRKLEDSSNAHKYSYLMRKDTKNQMKTYVKIGIDEIEEFLKK